MEQEYLTIPEAMAHTGKSEVTIRRFIRSLRHQYGVELDDTTDQLQEKTLVLRKTKEGKDKNDEPVFQWLIARSSLSSLIDDRRYPVHQDPDEPHEDRHDDPHRDGHEQGINESKTTPDDGLDDIHAVPHDDGREGLDPPRDRTHVEAGQSSDPGHDQLDELNELRKEKLDLQILNKGKDYYIAQLQKDKEGTFDYLTKLGKTIGELESKVHLLEAPSRDRSGESLGPEPVEAQIHGEESRDQ